MFSHRLARLTVLGGAVALVLGVAAPTEAHHAGSAPGPVNAQTTYGWGKPAWQDDFVGPLKTIWRKRGTGVIRNQHGMLTLNTDTRGSASATLTKAGHETGRWEIRLRSRHYETGHTPYKVRTELIPSGDRDQHCGARNVALESYTLGGSRAHLYIRNLPDVSFNSHTGLNLGNDRWHTFAVEVTRKRISWFVDAHVLVSERRTEALSGVPFTVRFTMLAQKDKRMNRGRMQMDWLRYFTLEKPNSKSVDAPQARKTTYADAC